MNNNPNPRIVFLHLPKTAGNTLLDVFCKNFLLRRITAYYPSIDQSQESWIQSNHKNVAASKMLIGHFAYGIHEQLPINVNVSYATMLRHPVARTISYYYFARRHPLHYLHKEANKLSITNFVSEGLCGEVNNGQTRLLAGIEAVNKNRCTDADFRLAVEHLDGMLAVGIQERFDESLCLFKLKMGLSSCIYTSKNVTKERKKADEATLEVITEYNQFDMKLYEMASQKLNQQSLEYPNFEHLLNSMKRANKILGPLSAPYATLLKHLAIRNVT